MNKRERQEVESMMPAIDVLYKLTKKIDDVYCESFADEEYYPTSWYKKLVINKLNVIQKAIDNLLGIG